MQRQFGVTTGEASSTSLLDSRDDALPGKALGWEDLLQSQRVLLVAEAGAGKTYECKAKARSLYERGEPAFFLRLEEVAANGVRSSLNDAAVLKRFDDWRASASQVGYFFLDSIDELHLVHGDFREALERLARDLEGGLGRATVLVTSRPVEIDRRAFKDLLPVPAQALDEAQDESFVRMAMQGPNPDETDKFPAFREVCLLPFSDPEVIEFARAQYVTDPEQLMAAIRARHAGDFARRPQDLIELCDGWKQHKRILSHYEQIKSHIKVRLKPNSKRKELAELSMDKARDGVERLALGAMLSRRLTIRISPGADLEGSGDAPLVPDGLLTSFTGPELLTLLERPIFAEGGYGRVRFHHRSVLEFLAACQIHRLISSGAMAMSAAKRLLFSLSESQELMAKPSMRPVAGWLALMRSAIFDAVLEVEPEILLMHGDPESLSDEQCTRALRAFIARHGAGQWRGLEVPDLQLERLARKPLHQVVLDAWASGVENPEVRIILVKLVATGRYSQCASLAATIAADKQSDNRERFEALSALVQLDDHRLDALIEDAVALRKGWNARIGRWIAINLYPSHLTEEQLLRLLTAVQRDLGDDYFPSSLADVIERVPMQRSRFEALLPGLLALARTLVVVDRDGDSLGDRVGRLRVSYLLRALCIRLLQEGSSAPQLVEAAVLGFRAAGHSSFDEERKQRLSKLLDAVPLSSRRHVFAADLNCIARLEGRDGAQQLLARVMFQGPLQYSAEKDGPWALVDLGNPTTDWKHRSVLMRMLIFFAPRVDEEGASTAMDAIKAAIADSSALEAECVELLKSHTPSKEYLQWQEQDRKRKERHALKLASDRADWLAFWTELANRPALALAPGRADNTIWNLAKVLRKRAKGNDRNRWDRHYLEQAFSGAVTNELRKRLMAYWRAMTPTLASERQEKNTYLVVWTVGLMGLYAEAENPRWTQELSADDAKRAVRYALVEIDGLPDWLTAVTEAYPEVVEQILGDEILSELQSPGGDGGWHSMLLQSLRYGRREIAHVLQRRLVAWLQGPGWQLMDSPYHAVSEAKLDKVVRVLIAHGNPFAHRWLKELATRQTLQAHQSPFLSFWLPVLFRLDPVRAAAVLLHVLDGLPVEIDGLAVRVIGSLFAEQRFEGGGDWSANLTAETLLRLTRAAYRHIEELSDLRREGVYSPSARDHAQDGRRHIFNTLIHATGADALHAKLELSADPTFARARDRIAAMARERLAEEIDAGVPSMEDLAQMLSGNELSPMTTTDMAHLLSDRLDDLQDLMDRDASPRKAWAEVSDENSLRAAIAREFETLSNGAYTVGQENATIEDKEKDIVLQSTSNLHACIELKVGEKDRSAKELRDAIEGQLVKKYMRPKQAKTGCFLVTVADPAKTWPHPDTGAPIDRHALEKILAAAAQMAQEKLAGDARVMARVLDLTPKLPKEPGRRKGIRTRSKAVMTSRTGASGV